MRLWRRPTGTVSTSCWRRRSTWRRSSVPAWLTALPEAANDLKPLLAELLASVGATGFDGTSQTLQPVVQLASAAIAAMRREQAGDRIGPWRLERLLAEGGMGAVWALRGPMASCSALRR